MCINLHFYRLLNYWESHVIWNLQVFLKMHLLGVNQSLTLYSQTGENELHATPVILDQRPWLLCMLATANHLKCQNHYVHAVN